MPKIIGLTDYILLGAAFAADLIGEVKTGAGIYRSALRNRYGYVPDAYKKSSYFTTVSRLLKTGEIVRKTKGTGEVYLELTPKGEKKIKRKYPLALKNQRWDGKFMIVTFDIPEERRKKRDLLRDKLIELGFGMLQKSVWISPYHFEEDMREFVEYQGLGNDVFVLKAKEIWAGNFQKLVKKIWKLEEINDLYKQIIENANTVRNADTQDKDVAVKINECLLEALSKDPMLPEELLPDNWQRGGAVKAVNEIG